MNVLIKWAIIRVDVGQDGQRTAAQSGVWCQTPSLLRSLCLLYTHTHPTHNNRREISLCVCALRILYYCASVSECSIDNLLFISPYTQATGLYWSSTSLPAAAIRHHHTSPGSSSSQLNWTTPHTHSHF